MLSYQHGYHAGNIADIVKHLALTRLLTYMTQKEKPLFYLETHAGRGVYDLQNQQAQKTGEAKHGIHILWDKQNQLPPVFFAYLSLIKQLNSDEKLRYYPGSPYVALHSLRSQDRQFYCELHPGEFEHLQDLRHTHSRVFYSHSNGMEKLRSLLPPSERRGLIFLDPSYEIKTEYRTVPDAIHQAFQRFSTGVYCLWYPIIDKKYHAQLLNGLKNMEASKSLRIEFYFPPITPQGMAGCGLWIINPPYTIHKEMEQGLKTLSQLLHPKASYLIEPSPHQLDSRNIR